MKIFPKTRIRIKNFIESMTAHESRLFDPKGFKLALLALISLLAVLYFFMFVSPAVSRYNSRKDAQNRQYRRQIEAALDSVRAESEAARIRILGSSLRQNPEAVRWLEIEATKSASKVIYMLNPAQDTAR